ncbi:hypothetical protein TrLO_g3627 [Triparma laevis f. longispina]|nr:hypothetical protein TrLO_g3627 [Triparma laevis f. longispina]
MYDFVPRSGTDFHKLPNNFKRIVTPMGTTKVDEGACSLKTSKAGVSSSSTATSTDTTSATSPSPIPRTISLKTLQNGLQTMPYPSSFVSCSLSLCSPSPSNLIVSPWRYKKKAKEERRNFTETTRFSNDLDGLIEQKQILKPILLDGTASDDFHVREYKSKEFGGCWIVLVKPYSLLRSSLIKLIKELKGSKIYVDDLNTIEEVLDCMSLGVEGVGVRVCRDMAESGIAFNVNRVVNRVGGKLIHSEIDLKDTETYKIDEEVLGGSSGCGCGACEDGLSKGYICHLTNNGELLGKISLMQHNLWQVCKAASEC